MLIVFGFRTRASGGVSGQFFCPRCGADRHYRLQVIRRWFTLFFVPVIPLTKLGEQVKCQTCGTSFKPGVLTLPTSAQLSDALRNATRVAVVAVLRAGDPSNGAARQAAVRANDAAGIAAFDDQALEADLHQVDPGQLAAYLTPLAKALQEAGKEGFVAQVARVALAGGSLTSQQTAVLETIGASLQLSAAHLNGVLATVQQSLGAPRTDESGQL